MTDKTRWADQIDHNGFCFNCPECDERLCDAFTGAETFAPCPACGVMLYIRVQVQANPMEEEGRATNE